MTALPPTPFAGGFRFEQFFLGRTHGWGVFQDRGRAVRRRFALTIDGVWEGDELVLHEAFTYDDDARESRVWRITPHADRTYEARADDVIGAVRGAAGHDALTWSYRFALNAGGRRWIVRFDETFAQLGPDLVINRARVSKFGLRVGETTIVFQREAASSAESEKAAAHVSQRLALATA